LADPRQKDSKFKVLEWNAVILNQAKKAELHKTLEAEEMNIFRVLEASVIEENIKCFHFKNFSLNFISECRHIASGILTESCKPLEHVFSAVKENG
jgi:hypothetical protein